MKCGSENYTDKRNPLFPRMKYPNDGFVPRDRDYVYGKGKPVCWQTRDGYIMSFCKVCGNAHIFSHLEVSDHARIEDVEREWHLVRDPYYWGKKKN